MPDKVLLVSSSTEPNVCKALLTLKTHLFPSSRLDLACSLAELSFFEGRTELHQIFVFPHRRDFSMASRLLSRVWREKYDVVAVLWCLDASRFRPKLFALLCGGRRLLVFNENLDCDYLSPKFLKNLVVARCFVGSIEGWVLGSSPNPHLPGKTTHLALVSPGTSSGKDLASTNQSSSLSPLLILKGLSFFLLSFRLFRLSVHLSLIEEIAWD